MLTMRPMIAGISNQKLALLGLVLHARALGKGICLPSIVSFVSGQDDHVAVPFDTAFDGHAFAVACAGFDVPVGPAGQALPIDPQGLFDRASAAISDAARAGASEEFRRMCILLAALRPAPAIAMAVTEVQAALPAGTTACQLRIEADWQRHVTTHLDRLAGPKDHYGLSYHQILAKLRATFGDAPSPIAGPIYITCDDRQTPVPPATIARDVRRRLGLELVFQGDVLAEARRGAALDRSLVDFEVALHRPRFVGNTRSSFFNLAALTAFGRDLPTEFWVYDNRGPRLKRRTDHGAFCRAGPATR